MDTAAYYTLSTIAQTLAGAFGFLVAVALYRLDAITNLLPSLESKALRDGTIRDSIQDTSVRATWTGYADAAAAVVSAQEANAVSIKAALGRSLGWTGGTIAACLVGLPAVGFLENVPWGGLIAWICTLPVVLLSLWCLWLYRPIIAGIIDTPGRSPVPPPAG